MAATTCNSTNNMDTVEKYFHKLSVKTPELCCSSCESNPECVFATFHEGRCYLKNAKTMTKISNKGVMLFIRSDKPTPPPGPTPSPPPGPAPTPPLPPPKYKVDLVEHSPLPTLSSANSKGNGASPCEKTFNPAYVEVKGKNKAFIPSFPHFYPFHYATSFSLQT